MAKSKDELLMELRRIDVTPDSYNRLTKAANTVSRISYGLIGLGVIAIVAAILFWDSIGTIVIEAGILALISGGLVYAFSALLEGVGAILLDTSYTKNLIKLKFKNDNDLF